MRMNTAMRKLRHWRRGSRRGVSEIIGAILLVALTITAGVILWSFRINTPPSPPNVSFLIRSGGSNPVWGDPTDCQPWGYTLNFYNPSNPPSRSQLSTWLGNPNDGPSTKTWFGQCGDGNDGAVTGNFSTLNSTQIIISAHSPASILLSQIEFTFVCNNASSNGGTTVLVNGSLASMTWFPGLTSQPQGFAPLLGHCGSFDAGGYGGALFSTYFNRLGIFVPLNEGVNTLENGDTFILYIHNGGYPLDFECVANAAGIGFENETATNGCLHPNEFGAQPVVQLDYDDYHGAPPWCFQSVGACTIYMTYTGYPQTLLATIPVYSLAPPTSN
jgi:flagellin-like protein